MMTDDYVKSEDIGSLMDLDRCMTNEDIDLSLNLGIDPFHMRLFCMVGYGYASRKRELLMTYLISQQPEGLQEDLFSHFQIPYRTILLKGGPSGVEKPITLGSVIWWYEKKMNARKKAERYEELCIQYSEEREKINSLRITETNLMLAQSPIKKELNKFKGVEHLYSTEVKTLTEELNKINTEREKINGQISELEKLFD